MNLRMHSPGKFRIVLVYIFLVLASGAAGTEPPRVMEEADVVVLPKYEVKTERVLPPLEKWQYVSVPGFEILSNISRKNTERFVRDFYLLQQVARILLPAVKEQSSLPAYIVLCGYRKDFENFVPKDGRDPLDPVTSSLLGDGERNAMVVDLVSAGNRELSDGAGDGTFRRFYLQYFRSLIRRSSGGKLPYWMEEGIVQLFAATEFSNKEIKFARLDGESVSANTDDILGSSNSAARAPGDQGVPDKAADDNTGYMGKPGDFLAYFKRSGLIPLKEFFAVTRDVPTGKRPVGYESQAYLFTHMCLYGRGQQYSNAFFQLAQQASVGAVTEEFFKKCFGMSFNSMGVEMRTYLNFTDYKAIEMTAKKQSQGLMEAPVFTTREASDAESSRIVGEVLRMGGQREAAVNRLVAPYVRGQYDADLLAALGLAELEAGHAGRARKFLDEAIKVKTTRTRAYLEIGKLRATEITAKAEAERRPLTAQEAQFIQEPLYEGLKHPPSMPALCAFLARTWLISPVLPSRAQFDELVVLGQAHYTDLGLVYRVAELGIKCDRAEISRQFTAFGIANSRDENSKARFEALSRTLPPVKAATGK